MARSVGRSACAPCSALKKTTWGVRGRKHFGWYDRKDRPARQFVRHSTSLNCARMEPVAVWPNVSLSTSTTDGGRPFQPLHKFAFAIGDPHCITRINMPAFRQLCTSARPYCESTRLGEDATETPRRYGALPRSNGPFSERMNEDRCRERV